MFLDSELSRTLDRQGWIKVPFLAPEQLERLRSLHVAKAEAMNRDALSLPGLLVPGTRGRKVVKKPIDEIVRPSLERLFASFHIYHSVFFSKRPGAGDLRSHMDPSIIDETADTSVVVWAPLDDVDATNGCLQVLSGSHRRMPPYRGHTDHATYGAKIIQQLPDECWTPLRMGSGEAAIFHPALLHRSGPNTTDVDRVAVQMYVAPSACQLLLCRSQKDGTIARYRITPDLLNHFAEPEIEHLELELLDIVEWWPQPPEIAAADILSTSRSLH